MGTITLRRPEKRNALDFALWLSLSEVLRKAVQDSEVRVILLKGAGDSFCSGLDLSPTNEVIRLLSEKPSADQKIRLFDIIKRVQAIYTELEVLRVPTIAVIQGHCLGAGLELVCSCDMRFCSSDALFGLPEPRFGIITDIGGLQRLPKVVGRGKAREMAFRGHSIGADEAKRIGLVNEVFDTQEMLFVQASKIGKEIAVNAPLAVQGAKEVLLHSEDVSASRSLEYNAARSAMILPSGDLQESFRSYSEKRDPKFKGN
ncbi:MAG: enoyl-CoA hydratase/isomerase family protein [Deltaproteobacteria bacterium]|nr:enoyl-CoA hydratase/isomerase family protein [Deltaproteobacteria bacterium]MBW2339837.1 enoyl-CoA hydratase/isomerase family protein [Deltaproteobacteria bacterium]